MGRLASVASALVFVLLAGCAPARPSGPKPVTGPEEYFPLAAGTAWSYDAEGALVVLRVERRDGAHADLGQFSYEIRQDGIVKLPAQKYVLKVPVAVGLSWPLPGGGQARITSVSASITGLAGDFANCVVVEEDDGAGTRTKTTFAPGVGPVDVEVSRGLSVTHARLRGFTRAGEEL
jgi:hypothetical protein